MVLRIVWFGVFGQIDIRVSKYKRVGVKISAIHLSVRRKKAYVFFLESNFGKRTYVILVISALLIKDNQNTVFGKIVL